MEGVYGDVRVLKPEGIFRYCKDYLEDLARRVPAGQRRAVGLSGGSTPKAFFAWWRDQGGLQGKAAQRLLWTVSDERCVPLEDEQSNMGEVTRLLLDPSGVPQENRLAWPTGEPPAQAAQQFEAALRAAAGPMHTCFLGMGEDGHTASLWPGCPLLHKPEGPRFAATQWPKKGWRLTITLSGLKACEKIIVLVSGKAKAPVLKAVWEGPEGRYPIQALQLFAQKVIWLVDESLM